jgi:hypothetical protein
MVARGPTPRILAIPKIMSLQFHFRPVFSAKSDWAPGCISGERSIGDGGDEGTRRTGERNYSLRASVNHRGASSHC